jgi:tricorn protease
MLEVLMKTFQTLLAMILLTGNVLIQAEEARLLRFPDVQGDRVAFVYAGDIYTVSRSGGNAVRLTSHEGLELFPKFSPDGDMIAFTGQYDGDLSVYVMPTDGGRPRRLTYHPGIARTSERMGPENIVMDWHPDGKSVLFRSRKETIDVWAGRAYLANINGGMPEPLPMAIAGFTSFSPDASKVAYCPIFRDFRMWKRYKGGMAQDVWIFDLTSNDAQKITDWEGTDNLPMWYQDKIYFNSDRTGKLNIYCYDINTGQTRQVTRFDDYDVRWPSLGPDGMAFENAGYIYVMDLPSETVNKVPIELASDQDKVRPEFIDLSDQVYDYALSPEGKRAVFSARGEIITVPAKEGNSRNLTNSSGAHDKHPNWSPNGKWIAFISDETGEDEIYLISQDGSEKKTMTKNNDCRKYGMQWSPDSKKLVFSDKNLRLFYLDIESEKTVRIDKSKRGEIHHYSWSPDSRYLAYAKSLDNSISAIFVYSFDDDKLHQITEGFSDDYSPVFDPDGKYLYFLARRDFNPILSNYEFEFVNNAITNLFLVLLSADDKSPFAPESDEVAVKDEDEEENNDSEGNGKDDRDFDNDNGDGEKNVKIDFDGIFDRQIAFDLPAGNYGGLDAVSGAVFYTSRPLRGLMGRIGKGKTSLHKYDLEEQEDNEFASGVGGFALSPDGKKMLLRRNSNYHIIGTSGVKASFDDNRVDLSNMEMRLDRRAEYNQIFNEVWRLHRDFFYDENMHGVDWDKMHERYEVLLPYVSHRFDLTYVLAEMVGELSCSHTYVGGGDMPSIPSSNVGLLGADFEIDKSNNRIRIGRILRGENWDDRLRSPLTKPEIDVNEGDYLLAIDGHEITADINPYAITENAVDKTLTLTVNDKPTTDGAREIEVKPLRSESRLRYYNWVEDNRRYVDSVSDGEIGYIHIPDMGGFGLVRFAKMFYHQIRKEGLVIDVRYNGGGFVSQLVLERLRAKLAGVSVSRNSASGPRPGNAVNAHMVTLQNQFSCSDGDNFPYYFRFYELGELMGMRTWGGVVGIRGFRPMMDGGYATVPEFTQYSLESEWIMENVGVIPDIEVENMPDRAAKGFDDQLTEAVKYIQQKMKDDPKTLPPHPGPPEER